MNGDDNDKYVALNDSNNDHPFDLSVSNVSGGKGQQESYNPVFPKVNNTNNNNISQNTGNNSLNLQRNTLV